MEWFVALVNSPVAVVIAGVAITTGIFGWILRINNQQLSEALKDFKEIKRAVHNIEHELDLHVKLAKQQDKTMSEEIMRLRNGLNGQGH